MTFGRATFHDATLLGVQLHWATGTTTVSLRTADRGQITLKISGCTEVSLPRHEAWGHSASVMSVEPLEGDLSVGLVIELQSGDRLLFRGNASEGIEAPSER